MGRKWNRPNWRAGCLERGTSGSEGGGWKSACNGNSPTAYPTKVVAWRKLGETCAQYLTRGRAVLVEGDLAAEAYLDREGKPVAKLVLTATIVQFLGGRGNGDDPAAAEAAALALPEDDATPATAKGATFAATFEADDDLPF